MIVMMKWLSKVLKKFTMKQIKSLDIKDKAVFIEHAKGYLKLR